MQARFGFNEHNPSGSPRQCGGAGVISLGKLKHHSMGSGTDESGLGQWTWAQCRGKNNISLRAVSIHQPCANKDGVMSAWAQQKAYLQDQNDDRDPRSAFREDLQKQIQTWIDTGDQLMTGGDVNESVLHPSISSMFQES